MFRETELIVATRLRTSSFRSVGLVVTGLIMARASMAHAQEAPPVAPPVAPAPAAPAAAPPVAAPPVGAPPASSAPASPAPPAEEKASEPFAFGDFTWLNGNNRQKTAVLDSEYFTGSFMLDVNYTMSNQRPIDHTVVGSTALARDNEFTLSFLGFGGDFHHKGARGRLMMQFGTRSTVVPRNDFSTTRGQFELANALRYVSEAYGGHHWDTWHGINLDVGIFMSYVGLMSYSSHENWSYQPSFTSDNTPWFFNGARLQTFPTDTLKVELWMINGWQTYAKFNEMPGFGSQILWRPKEWVSAVSNNYVGWDTANHAGRMRFHSDNSLLIRWFNNPGGLVSKAAFSVTQDIGFENGQGVVPFGGSGTEGNCTSATPCSQNFISGMAYHRVWFDNDHFGWTVGAGYIHNPGRYLVLLPTGAALTQFDSNAGTKFDGWDMSTTLQYMPDPFQTWGLEFVHREASIPYFAGHGGVTSPDGYTTTAVPPGWKPDQVKAESRVIGNLLVRFLPGHEHDYSKCVFLGFHPPLGACGCQPRPAGRDGSALHGHGSIGRPVQPEPALRRVQGGPVLSDQQLRDLRVLSGGDRFQFAARVSVGSGRLSARRRSGGRRR